GLDHRGEAHGGIEAPDLEGRPTSVRQRCCPGPRGGAKAEFWQQQARRVHAPAGDVGVDVDGAGHDDLAGCIVGCISTRSRLRFDDAPIAHPNVPDLVATVGGIDDAAALDMGQHGNGSAESSATMATMASATERASLRCVAATATRVPIIAQCSTLSWSQPGPPTAM